MNRCMKCKEDVVVKEGATRCTRCILKSRGKHLREDTLYKKRGSVTKLIRFIEELNK